MRDSSGALDYAEISAAAVAALDPLNADEVCAQLPAMNRRGEVSALATALRQIMPTGIQVSGLTVVECLAAMRDIGILLGSIKRHGVQPTAAVPEIEEILLALAGRTDLVPRDTLHHYTCWNPCGTRRRMYTGDPQETHLIDAVRTAMPWLSRAITACERVTVLEPGDPDCAAGHDELGGQLHAMVEAIDRVMAHVSPVFFARGLRPYFEEITVAGRSYLGPAAANMPIALIDLALWASDRGDGSYLAFKGGALASSWSLLQIDGDVGFCVVWSGGVPPDRFRWSPMLPTVMSEARRARWSEDLFPQFGMPSLA